MAEVEGEGATLVMDLDPSTVIPARTRVKTQIHFFDQNDPTRGYVRTAGEWVYDSEIGDPSFFIVGGYLEREVNDPIQVEINATEQSRLILSAVLGADARRAQESAAFTPTPDNVVEVADTPAEVVLTDTPSEVIVEG